MKFERSGLINYQIPDHPAASDLDQPKIKFPEKPKKPDPTDRLKKDGKHKEPKRAEKGQLTFTDLSKDD